MTIVNSNVVAELLYYSEQVILNSSINKDKIPFTSSLTTLYLQSNSFIRLLFDESWPTSLTTYRYLHRLETDTLSIPDIIRRRMMVYPTSSKYYVCDSDDFDICNVNVFNLQDDDITLLNKLLEYRIDSTSVTLIDIEYESLETNLSKLIYIYLNFKINDDYLLFDNSTLISSNDNVLENFYESFISDLIFKYLTEFEVGE